MNAKTLLLSLIFALTSLNLASAQTYELGWSDVNRAPSEEKSYTLNWDDVSSHVDRAVPVPELPAPHPQPPVEARKVAPPFQRQAALPAPVRPARLYNVEFSTSQYYDTYAGRYLKVKAVEVETFRMGSYVAETYENRGDWNTYPVYLKNLKEGDRFRVRVIWDNGSNRTIDKTVDNWTDRTFYVSQPDYLAYTAW